MIIPFSISNLVSTCMEPDVNEVRRMQRAFRRTIKIISSCENIDHVKSARRYIMLFHKMFPFSRRAAYALMSRLSDRIYELPDDDLIRNEPWLVGDASYIIKYYLQFNL